MDKKTYILFGLAFGILLTALVLYQWNAKRMEEYTKWVTHTLEVIFRFQKLASDVKSVQIFPANMRSNHPNNLIEFENPGAKGIPADLDSLRFLVRDNPVQVKRVDTLTGLVKQHLAKLLHVNPADTVSTNTSADIIPLISIQLYIDKGVAMEKQLLAKRRADLDASQRVTGIMRIVFIIVGLLLIMVVAFSNFYQIARRNTLEAFLSSVLNTSQTGILACEAIREKQQIANFKILFSNNALRKQMEMKDGEVMKETLLGISPSAIERGTFKKYVHTTDTGEASEFEVSVKRGPVTRWYQINISKLNDGFIASYSEITDLKNSQQQLQKKVTELERINSELEQYAYVASHDLQEPLRKIKTFSSLIVERFNEPSASFAKVYLNKVIVAANRMSGLINDLLNFSSLSDQSQQFVETDLNSILKNICDDFELTIQEKDAVVTCGDLHSIEAIPLQMNQLFYNLINNALKFSKTGVPPVINVSAALLTPEEAAGHQLDAELTYQEIIVTDNGIGFNPEYAQKIFVIFQRLNNKEAYSGTGIGLALCHKIVTNHNGIIHAASKLHRGASFHVILPLQQPTLSGQSMAPVSR